VELCAVILLIHVIVDGVGAKSSKKWQLLFSFFFNLNWAGCGWSARWLASARWLPAAGPTQPVPAQPNRLHNFAQKSFFLILEDI
jgi:hypothetical protein